MSSLIIVLNEDYDLLLCIYGHWSRSNGVFWWLYV